MALCPDEIFKFGEFFVHTDPGGNRCLMQLVLMEDDSTQNAAMLILSQGRTWLRFRPIESLHIKGLDYSAMNRLCHGQAERMTRVKVSWREK